MSTSSATTPSVSLCEADVVGVPSYLRGTAASAGKRRTKVVLSPKPEPTLSKDGGRRSAAARKRVATEGHIKGYQQLTKAARAKVSPRSYVLQGVRVEVPQVALVEFEACEEDKAWFVEKMETAEAKLLEKLPEVDLLFVGRHTYYDGEGAVAQPRDAWKEVFAEQNGVEWNEFRICRSWGLNIEDYDE